MPISSHATVIDFWLNAGPSRWFKRNKAFDQQIKRRFEGLHLAVSRGEHLDWAQTPQGALALLILADQFPRNMWRGSAHAYATDPIARTVAETAIARGFDREVAPELRIFFYLPFEHSERIEDQERAVALVDATGDADLIKWAGLHRDIIARFGRFPHRNACLGRQTTPDEQAFLDGGGFSG